MSCVSSCPARPTNGSPLRSSCSPGPSPTNSRSASATPDTEHHLGPAGGELAEHRNPTPRPRPRRASRRRRGRDAGMRGTSRVTRRSPTDTDTATSLPGCCGKDGPMLPGRDANRVGDDVGGHGAQAIEVGLDRPGRERDREIAVEAGVGRSQRTGEPVVRALRDEMARGLVADGIGHDHDEGRVGADLARTACRRGIPAHPGVRSSPRPRSRRRRSRRRRRSPRRTRPRGVVAARRRRAEAARHRVLAAAPLPDGRAPPGADPPGRGRAGAPRRRPRSRRRAPARHSPTRRDRTRTQRERSAPDPRRWDTPAPARRASASPRRPPPTRRRSHLRARPHRPA